MIFHGQVFRSGRLNEPPQRLCSRRLAALAPSHRSAQAAPPSAVAELGVARSGSGSGMILQPTAKFAHGGASLGSADGRTRTGKGITPQEILSLLCLPFHHIG